MNTILTPLNLRLSDPDELMCWKNHVGKFRALILENIFRVFLPENSCLTMEYYQKIHNWLENSYLARIDVRNLQNILYPVIFIFCLININKSISRTCMKLNLREVICT